MGIRSINDLNAEVTVHQIIYTPITQIDTSRIDSEMKLRRHET